MSGQFCRVMHLNLIQGDLTATAVAGKNTIVSSAMLFMAALSRFVSTAIS